MFAKVRLVLVLVQLILILLLVAVLLLGVPTGEYPTTNASTKFAPVISQQILLHCCFLLFFLKLYGISHLFFPLELHGRGGSTVV